MSRGAAWLEAVKALRFHNGVVYNLVVEILQPDLKFPINAAAQNEVDRILIQADELPVASVAETIFPAWEFIRHGADGVHLVYPDEVYPAIQSLPANRWGTYAYRLVRRRDADGGLYNPLERVVDKLRGELKNAGPKRAAYELDAEGHGLSTYDPETDWNNYLGGQCLSHISLKLGPERELYLTATYRHQYFIRKALGNFLGLARLQAFVAQQASIPVGPLVCHATLARLDCGNAGAWGLHEIDALIAELKPIAAEGEV
jgi:hypothetical protein